MRLAALATAPVLIAGLAACSSSNSGGSSSSSPAANCATPGSPSTPPEVVKDNVTVSGPLNQKPTISIVAGNRPPQQQVQQDVAVGCGPEATAGSEVSVQYEGVFYANGTSFDNSWDRGQPTSFPLSRVIPCWQTGIVGMKVGGRRMLICPPDTAYGPQGNPPTIPPESTLVFVVDLVGLPGSASASSS